MKKKRRGMSYMLTRGNPYSILWHWEKQGRLRHVSSAVRARIMSVMAAAEAEVEFFGNCAGGDSDDRDQIEEMAASSDSYFSSEEWERWEPRMRRHTRSLVKRHRAKIERVARALIKHETLSAQRIDSIAEIQHPVLASHRG
jgi:hypothetical protein